MRFFLFFLLFIGSASAANVASINPIYQILLAISGDKNNSILIINPRYSEHDYQLKKSDIMAFAKANLVFYADDFLEKNFPKMIKNFKLENRSYQLSKVPGIRLLQARNDSGKSDLHFWLDPQNGIRIAEFIAEKLCENEKSNCQKYRKNLLNFKQEVAIAEKKIRSRRIDLSQAVIYHDGYQYFEDYFDVKPAKVLTSEHGREPRMQMIRDFDNLAKSGKIKCVFGEVLDERNFALKLAQNYGLKFIALDAVGSKENSGLEENGYAALLLNIASGLSVCDSLLARACLQTNCLESRAILPEFRARISEEYTTIPRKFSEGSRAKEPRSEAIKAPESFSLETGSSSF